MPFCGQCGEKLGNELNFCPVCGAKVVKIDSSRKENIGQESEKKPIRRASRQNIQPQGRPEFACYYHPQVPSVVTCGNCGIGMCKECEEDAFMRTDNGLGKAVCDRCSLKSAEVDVKYDEKWLRKSRFKLIFGTFFIILGAIPLAYMIAIKKRDINGIVDLIGFWAIGCAILSIGNKSKAPTTRSQVFDALYDYNHPIASIIIGILVKACFAPFYLISEVIFHFRVRKEYKSDLKMVEAIQCKMALMGFYMGMSGK